MNAHKHSDYGPLLGVSTGTRRGFDLQDARRRVFTFHIVSHLRLPATKLPKNFHHLHASETYGQRFATVNDSDNVMTMVDVSDCTPIRRRLDRFTSRLL
jgi:hypothetical protein